MAHYPEKRFNANGLCNDPQKSAELYNKLIQLSFQAMGFSSPNPPVACVISDPDGNIISSGHTQRTGSDHAEKFAYRSMTADKSMPHNVYVTLEPCTHFGKTPPCIDLIIEKKPENLFFGEFDPNPIVKKRNGLEEAGRAGIAVSRINSLIQIAESFLSGFFSRIQKKRPTFLLKAALSRDGFFCVPGKQTRRFTGNDSDAVTQFLRAKFDAVLVGPGTLQMDLPGLDFRCPIPVKGASVEKAGNLFFETLFNEIAKEEVAAFHKENEFYFQPLRIFVIGDEQAVSEDFFRKQSSLNEKYKTRKILFFLIGQRSGNIYSSEFLAVLRNLSAYKLHEISLENPGSEILSILAEYEINTLLVEGGNLMFDFCAGEFSPNDGVLIIEGTDLLGNGNRPAINITGMKSNFTARAGDDTWTIYSH
ncbi:MAG: bifunctional diaminohydroxyphosphoribosylaminopyrimidine deaminase/5-amino-6-(5-phosphoribosylamino)uracil reductase [Leptospira sp.]|nr:bifunctional diaminohydroxyphosphoribosylaminopyrimidine deaminase/5-amino-6-(5-phosphoribosylamino)uracil reductase [Leptospira sp.]